MERQPLCPLFTVVMSSSCQCDKCGLFHIGTCSSTIQSTSTTTNNGADSVSKHYKPHSTNKKINNSIYVIGYNYWGQLSLDASYIYPLTDWNKCNTDINITSLKLGNKHAIYYNNNNQKYWASGSNTNGQCCITMYDMISPPSIIKPCLEITYFNDHHMTIQNVFTNINSDRTFWLTNTNQIYRSGESKGNGPILCTQLTDIVDIKSNKQYSIALQSSVLKNEPLIIIHHWCATLDIPTDITDLIIEFYNITKVYTISNAKLHKQEWNIIEILADTDIVKIETNELHSLFLESDGTLWYGQFMMTNLAQPFDFFMQDDILIKDIKCGEKHTLAVDYNNNIYSWGRNFHGQCGDGSKYDIAIPKLIVALKDYNIVNINCGLYHSHAQTDDNKHYLWGKNGNHQCLVFTEGCVLLPHLINDAIKELTNGKIINDIYLGFDNTIVITN
eukprot:229297_1